MYSSAILRQTHESLIVQFTELQNLRSRVLIAEQRFARSDAKGPPAETGWEATGRSKTRARPVTSRSTARHTSVLCAGRSGLPDRAST